MEEINDYEDDFEVEEGQNPFLKNEEEKDEDGEPPSNEVYMWGDDSRGQLGLSGVFGDAQHFEEP